jgi:hypothetical protein
LPAASAVVFVTALFLPSYWKFEPRQVTEGFDVTLAACAIAAMAIVAAACVRGVSTWRRAARRTRAWMATARPLALPGTSIPAFAIDADAPVMALVGVLRPRLLVTRGLIDALTDDELAASVAHELGHCRAWDNLKRLAMRSAPDVLAGTAAVRHLERRWASASEHCADHRASDDNAAVRCALASALVKVARLTPLSLPSAEPISTLVGGGDIASRVHHLLAERAPASSGSRARPAMVLAGSATLMAVTYAPVLRAVHDLTEVLVRFLP